MNELELISRLLPGLPSNDGVIVGAGDDCAVLSSGGTDHQIIFKTDAVVEGIHFEPDAPPDKVGRKALARCLSDIAAMAGTPTSALVTIGLPGNREAAWVEEVYAGMGRLAREHGVAIVGGETTRCPERAFLSLALLGQVPAGGAVLRSGAKPGDALFVTGELGGSLAGKHLEFKPRLREARWLADRFEIHAMIDLSDGLASDLRHVLRASNVGAELLAGAIPISRAAKMEARRSGSAKPPLAAALTDGEDFELLFAVASKDAVPLLDQWKATFPDPRLGCIGKVTEDLGVHLRDKSGLTPLPAHGYVHLK